MRLAVLDVDGTLVQSVSVDDTCFVRAFRDEFGLTEVNTDWSTYESCTDAVVVPEILRRGLGREPSGEDVARHRRRFAALLRESLERDASGYAPTEGAQQLLDALRADPGWRTAIATGGWGETARFKLAAAGLEVEGIPLACADDARTREAIVRRARRRALWQAAVADFSGVVAVGDGVWDLETARNLGAGFVGIASGAGAERLRAAGAAAVRPHFLPLDAFLAELDTQALA